ncbi:MAG: hypothetical protein AAF555_04895 [Verrucomicrobiota bacterium]
MILFVSDRSWGGGAFLEAGGLVVMEAESTSSRLGSWKLKTEVPDYLGSGHLEFTGNEIESGPPKSPLRYDFQISTEGRYTLVMRAHKRLETKREDLSNDCYIELSGDFEPGGEASSRILRSENKFFGGAEEGWGWAQRLDVDHQQYFAVYQLKAGQTYRLTVSGRSKNFNLDRILLFHESHDLRKIRKESPPESQRMEAGQGGGSDFGLAQRTVRDLTNRAGVTISAQLLDKTDTAVVVLVSGQRVEIPFSQLSAEDQAFLRDWRP